MERFLLEQKPAEVEHHTENEALMPDMIDVPKIRIVLKAGQTPEPEAPLLSFLRWKLMPTPAPTVEPDEQEDEAKPSTVKA